MAYLADIRLSKITRSDALVGPRANALFYHSFAFPVKPKEMYTQKNRRKDALLSAYIWACVVIECAP